MRQREKQQMFHNYSARIISGGSGVCVHNWKKSLFFAYLHFCEHESDSPHPEFYLSLKNKHNVHLFQSDNVTFAHLKIR